jgi:hypothetical protein
MRTFWQSFYLWTRDLHLYFGLFISPFLLVFAASTVLLNHAWKPGERVETRTETIHIEEGLEDFAQQRQILEQLGVTGEPIFMRGFATREVVTIRVRKPGERTIVRVNVKNRRADVERRVAGFWDATIFLHVLPGPHKKPDWFFTKVWSWVADSTVYVVIFLSVSGIYLWAVLRAERRAGLISLGLGSVSFVLVLYRLVAG